MKQMLCALVLMSGILMVSASSFGATVFTSIGSGDAAYVTWSNSSSYGYVDVWKGGTVTSPYTYLTYYTYDYTANSRSYGWGDIPNSDFTVLGGKHASLITNVNADPDFHIGSGSGGTLSLYFQNNGVVSYSFTGTSKVSFNSGSMTYKNTGTGDSLSASVSGNCLGYNIVTDNAEGDIQRNKSLVITIDKQ